MLCAAGLRGQETVAELTELSLQDLMNLEVTSVSRRSERLSDAAASIFVITADDIRRSGATSLPEALRLAPSLEVAQVSSYGYAISARGLNDSAANKLLVMIDGRSVYTPLFAGVFWDVQDVMLEDIDRIEVISGPGGTLWGTNAVHGVINIITRSAAGTLGTLASAGLGTRTSNVAARYGGTAGSNGSYRVYAKYMDLRKTETASGTLKDDAAHRLQAGLRGDWMRGADELTLIANAYRGSEGQPRPGMIYISGVNLDLGVIPLSGVNLLGRWKRSLRGGSEITAQAYYDRTDRTVPPTFAETLDISDLQIQHTVRIVRAHTVTWGGGYRYARDRVENGVMFGFLPTRVNQRWASLFAQDEVSLGDRVRLTLGARLEHNDYTGREFLPNARLAWKPSNQHLIWAAASRTVRAPSRLDRDAFIPSTPPFLLAGGHDVRSEVAKVYELGYRGQPVPSASLSVTLFRASYDDLRSQEIAPSGTFVVFGNGIAGSTNGIELWASWQAAPWWRASAGFRGLETDFWVQPGGNDVAGVLAREGRDPARSWRLRSSFDLPGGFEIDALVRAVSALSSPEVPSYVATDLSVVWQAHENVELAITGQNLFDDGHGEFTDALTRSELGPSVFFRVITRRNH
jgi:iron complex outermembrane receptor protein